MTKLDYNQSVKDHSDSIYRFVLKNIGDADKAKDIVQDTYVKLWAKIEDVDPLKVKTYLFTVAYRTMIDAIRRDKKQTRFDAVSEQAYGYEDGYSDLKEILQQAISQLPEVQRSAIILRDYEGYSYKEIGDILSLNESQVKVYIFRSRAFLKKYLISIENVL